MESSSASVRSKRRRLISVSSYVLPQRPDLPVTFESLNDDTLGLILKFVGNKSYRSFGGLNKRCKEVYLTTQGMTKETFVFGYAPSFSRIMDSIETSSRYCRLAAKGVVCYNRLDVLALALQQQKKYLLRDICFLATEEGRLDILDEVLNNVEDDEYIKRFIFEEVGRFNYLIDRYAALHGKLEVLKWIETKGFNINTYVCAESAACNGYLHILQWLRLQEEKDLKLYSELYLYAIDFGIHLHVLKWLKEKEVPFHPDLFGKAVYEGNLDVLQWLHNEGCPWPEDSYELDVHEVHEEEVNPEVIEWLRGNGYGNRIVNTNDT